MEIFNSCCCCLLRPIEQHFKTPCTTFGKTEIFSDMLKECFNIHLTINNDESGICSVCVGRLRDASNFKLQVLHSQAELQVWLDRTLQVKDESQSGVKMETSGEIPSGGLINASGVKEEAPDDSASDECRNEDSDDEVKLTKNKTSERMLEIIPTPIHNEQIKRTDLKLERDVTLVCQICHKTFDSQRQLVSHMRVHDKRVSKKRSKNVGEIYICNHCGKEFSHKSNFIRHIEGHNDVRLFNCNVCGKRFRLKAHLVSHMLIHSGEKPYSCDICNKRFGQKSAVKVHKRIHTGDKPFTCDVCNKRFAQISALYTHQRVHTDKKPYTCDICGKGFRAKVNLTSHKRTHTGEKPYACDNCHMRFSEQSSLRRHSRIHSGEKPYTCETCNLKLRELSSYNRHKMTHTGQKPYACDICNSRFGRKSHLNRHKQIHTGEKPFCCEICGKRYTEQFTLNTHKRTHLKSEEPSPNPDAVVVGRVI